MKQFRSVLFGVFVTLCMASSFSYAEKRAITEKDLFQFQWIGNPQISPDGAQVAFVRIVVGEKQQYETSIWTVATAGGEPRKLTSGKHDSGPRWSPDGKYLAFQRSVEKDGKPEPSQIFILAMAGGEAWRLTEMPQGAAGPTWSPDGKTIAFTSGANPQDLAMAACEKEKDKSKCAKPEHEPDIHVVTRAVFRLNGEGYLDFSRPDHIWTIGFPSDPQNLPKPKQLTRGNFDEGELVWAPDASKIYFTSNRNLEPYYAGPSNVVYSVPAAGGEASEVAQNRRSGV